jgi:hypothetical protein
MYQDHQAHIQVHMSAMQDPKIQQLLQNNPMAQQMAAAMMAHVNEHLGFEYRKQIELQLGFNLPPQQDEAGEEINMDPEVEARLAPMLAQAAQQLIQKNQGEVAQQKAQQQAQDPIIQIQQQELQLKQAEQQRKAQKDQQDAQLRMQQLQVERERIQTQADIEAKKLEQDEKYDALKTAAQMRDNREKEMMRLGADILKHMSSQTHQRDQQREQLMGQERARNQPPPKGK